MKAVLNNLFEHHHQANLTYAAFFEKFDINHPKANAVFSHLLNAEELWLSRIQDRNPDFDLFEVHSSNKFDHIITQNGERRSTLLQDLENEVLGKVICYITTEGEPYESVLSDILFHLISHSAYHRGQLAILMRELGHEPPVTDYIFYSRTLQN